MKLAELKKLIVDACDAGYGECSVGVSCENDSVNGGTDVLGLRYATDNIGGKTNQYVSIIES